MHVDTEEREKRWSMNSQRLEEIVRELMKPIGDIRRNFDTDLSALLEEYLTEAGLRALEAGAADGEEEVAPNFAEIALLLQQSAHIYSRKVDCLYQDVLRVTDALNNSSLEEGAEGGEAEAGGAARQRPAAAGFAPIRLQPAAAPRREASLRPPPTLPRIYLELEPLPGAAAGAAEPVGLHAGFRVFSMIEDGHLEELEAGAARHEEGPPPPRLPAPPPLTLPQLSEPSPLRAPSPSGCSTPVPRPLKAERKRRSAAAEDADSAPKLLISEEVLRALRGEAGEFGLSPQLLRRALRGARGPFRGWDEPGADVGGFCGWPAAAARSALDSALGEAQRLRLRPVDESDDDGFFEQSSSSDGEPPPDWRQWREGVLARAPAAPDVRRTAALLLRSAPAAPAPPAPFAALLRHLHAAHGTRPAQLALAALFLASSGNVEVVAAEPLAVNAFSLRLLSADEARYGPALARAPL